MKYFNSRTLVFLLALLAVATNGSAGSWTCRQGELTRHVIVFYPDEPARLPCKVYYGKPGEDVLPGMLWESKNTGNYCERKAVEFVEKLGTLGWRCVSDDQDK